MPVTAVLSRDVYDRLGDPVANDLVAKINAAGAKAFEDYVTGTAGQQIIATFGIATFGIALFNADAGKDYSSLQ